jgi:hypothetical protein
MSFEKQTKIHHSVTENGNLQARIVTEYLKDGELIDKKYGDPYTPADTKDMTGWDDRSKDIVAAITDSKVLADFAVEKQEPTGIGIEEIVTTDRVIEEDGKIAVRRITRIYDDGVEVSKKYHRSWIMPGDDPTGNDVMSKAIAEKIHTPEVIDTYKAKMAELEAEQIAVK